MKNKGVLLHGCVAFVVAVTLVVATIFGYSKLNEFQLTSRQNIEMLEYTIQSNTRTVWCAATDISMGARITESMLIQTTIFSNLDPSHYFDPSEDLGKVATVPISTGMPVFKDMMSVELAEDLHERECSFIWLNTNLQENDFVDVRIMFPNGEDYIVASKKAVHNLRIAVNDVFLWLTEEETQLLSSAIVDANMHNARIYVTKYIKPEVQEASTPTYTPSSEVIRVITQDPNIVEKSTIALSVTARKAMDQRLQLFEEAYPGFSLNINAGSNSYYDATIDYNNGGEAELNPAGAEDNTSDISTTDGAVTTDDASTTDNSGGEVEFVD